MFSAASSKSFKASEPLNLGVLSSYLAFIILEKAFEKSLGDEEENNDDDDVVVLVEDEEAKPKKK